jgi:hypothetical protein
MGLIYYYSTGTYAVQSDTAIQVYSTVSASRVPYRSYVHNWPVRLVPDSEVPDSEARGYLAGHCAVQRRR